MVAQATLLLFGSFFVMLLAGVPISAGIGIASIFTALFSMDPAIFALTAAQRCFSGIDSFSLLALPFFSLGGNIMNNGGIAKRLVRLARLAVGKMPGYLAATNVLANMFFGAVSGSSVAATSAMGSIMAPLELDEGYDPNYSAAVNICSGSIDIHSADDCINAVNTDLTGFSYQLNISGGTVTARSDSGDGFDSNGDLTISGGNVTVWTANTADNEPLDADGTVTVSGGTVLAAGGSGGMGMSLAATQPCVIFTGSGAAGGMNMPGPGTLGGASLLAQGTAFTVTSADGIVLYSGEAVYNASFLFFSSGDLSDGESYTLSAGEAQTVSTAQTGTVRAGMGSRGDGNIGGMGGMGGQRPDGSAPPSGGFNSQKPDGTTPPEKPTGTPPQTDPGGTTA